MAHRDEYRGLIENARDAVRDLLNASTPDSWLPLRASYGGIVQVLEDPEVLERAAGAFAPRQFRRLEGTDSGEGE